MHFGFALELSDIDLWKRDFLDTHLGLLIPEISIQISPISILFVSIKSLRGLQDIFKTCLQDVFKTYLQDIFKTSSRHLGRRKMVTLKTSWRRLQEQQMFAGIELILTWSKSCALEYMTTRVAGNNNNPLLVAAPAGLEFQITDTKLYVPVVSLSPKMIKIFLKS